MFPIKNLSDSKEATSNAIRFLVSCFITKCMLLLLWLNTWGVAPKKAHEMLFFKATSHLKEVL